MLDKHYPQYRAILEPRMIITTFDNANIDYLFQSRSIAKQINIPDIEQGILADKTA